MAAAGGDFEGRSEAREEALALLYEADISGVSLDDVLVGRLAQPLEYATEIVSGIAGRIEAVDGSISRRLTGWRIERMPVLDRAVARIGAYELAWRPDVPTGVVLSEAVGLADAYCGDRSRRFLNGVLAALAADLRPDGAPGQPDEAPDQPDEAPDQPDEAPDQPCEAADEPSARDDEARHDS